MSKLLELVAALAALAGLICLGIAAAQPPNSVGRGVATDLPGSTPVQYYQYAEDLLDFYGESAVPAVSKAMANREISSVEYEELFTAGTELKRQATRDRVLRKLKALQPDVAEKP